MAVLGRFTGFFTKGSVSGSVGTVIRLIIGSIVSSRMLGLSETAKVTTFGTGVITFFLGEPHRTLGSTVSIVRTICSRSKFDYFITKYHDIVVDFN